ncbi:hypothetical protein HLB44_18485 [Aquincola sp. S2]|uniref:Uncharacterized protein n=1 Tax=Pseudaquabacterium terrae TaxID=2732868 RepID=A0ABX2EJZ3_9BURK|nr:hypothetical protein [Aquabacterium terrae]NRF68985.1 hypothetical protein [Aquabacterium terrae]
MAGMRPVEFANFVCTSGTDLEMLDMVDTVVLPAFSSGLRRTWGENTYFFHDVTLVDFAPDTVKGTPAICGRFVKDTVLHSKQVYRNGELLANNQKIKSAPSAFFVLLLEQHKLIYCSEYTGAPGIGTFRSTAYQFIGQAHKAYIDTAYEQFKEQSNADPDAERITKASLVEKFPRPMLEIVPLASEESIDQFVKRFKVLQAMTIRLIKPNNEINNERLYEQIQTESRHMGATASTLTYKNSKGLSQSVATDHAEAAADGNAEVTFSGKDKEGAPLKGSNEDFRVLRFIEELPSQAAEAARRLYIAFKSARQSGLITAEPAADTRHAAKLADLRSRAAQQ